MTLKNLYFSAIVSLLMLLASPQVLAQGAAASAGKAAGGNKCGDIKIDCTTHKISFNGAPTGGKDTINCGKSTPGSWSGSLPKLGKANGGVWASMKDADFFDLAVNGIGIHTLPPSKDPSEFKPGSCPAGLTSQTDHTGCINVDPEIMKLLKDCATSKVTISGGPAGTSTTKTDYSGKTNYSPIEDPKTPADTSSPGPTLPPLQPLQSDGAAKSAQ